ncbi:MAG: threonine synthase, partial [Muribaculaceae bacterium]|nr:threonine synthase [Muribaculaceae bacterium]
MRFISTRHSAPSVSLAEAMYRPIAPDGGLYMPESLPLLPRAVIDNMKEMTMSEIGYVVLNALLGSDFKSSELKQLAETALNFPSPMVSLDNGINILELFEGPTLSFKDFGARIMARLLELAFRPTPDQKLNIVMATTGNTGSAMASAMAGIKNVNVFVVFPRGTAGRALESQFTTLGGGIIPVEVSGTIDDCHAMVASALRDTSINSHLKILSANSINIARLLGQTIYYFYGVSHLPDFGTRRFKPVTLAIPAGNLGNLSACLIAKNMGLDIKKVIAAENANNYLTRAINDEDFEPRPAIPTLAYAADKSVPTNFERILDLVDGDPERLRSEIIPMSFSDSDIIR